MDGLGGGLSRSRTRLSSASQVAADEAKAAARRLEEYVGEIDGWISEQLGWNEHHGTDYFGELMEEFLRCVDAREAA